MDTLAGLCRAPRRGMMQVQGRTFRSLSIWPPVKVCLVAVRRFTPLHGEHHPTPYPVDRVLAQIIRKGMNLAVTASEEVNVVGAIERARVPGHEDHLHHIGDAQVIA